MILFEICRMFDQQPYLATMYKVLFCLAFYGLMRIGELAWGDHSLKTANIHIGQNKDKILLVLYTSKTHSKKMYPQQIKISSLKDQPDYAKCLVKSHTFFYPFNAVRQFIDMCKSNFGGADQNFFLFSDGSPVYPHQARTMLRAAIANLNLNPKLCNCHSMHAGRATQMLRAGIPDDQIKRLGKWRSNAVYHYLRD